MLKKTLILLCCLSAMQLHAQCTLQNTAVVDGEFISYNLYYNWKFLWVKAGTASMSTVKTVYKGKPSFRSSLITRGNGKLDNFFVLRDTLLGYTTTSLAPLYYRKGAREGDRYTVDEAFYSYPNGNVSVKLHRQKNSGEHVWVNKAPDYCVYDMINLFQRARSFNTTGWTKGHVINLDIADGVKLAKARLRYKGKETVKADNGKKYDCLKLSYLEIEDGKEKEIACFFVTDDKRHIPIRIDLSLRFGSAKAFLTSMK